MDNLEILQMLSARNYLRVLTNPETNEYRNVTKIPNDLENLKEIPTWSFYPLDKHSEYTSLAIDFDGDNSESDSSNLALILQDLDIPFFYTDSGNGYHIFIPLKEKLHQDFVSILRKHLLETFPSIDPTTMSLNQTIRGIGSVHRTLGSVETIIETNIKTQSDRATKQDIKDLAAEYFWYEVAEYDFDANEKLSSRDFEDKYISYKNKDRSIKMWKTIIWGISNGLTEQEVLKYLKQTRVSEKYRDRSNFNELLETQVLKAKKYVEDNRVDLEQWLQEVNQLEIIKGYTKPALMTLANAIAHLSAKYNGEKSFRVSLRQLSVSSNQSLPTVYKYVKFLDSQDLIDFIPNKESQNSSSTIVLTPRNLPDEITVQLLRGCARTFNGWGESGRPSIWSKENLGDVCEAIHGSLSDEPQTIRDIMNKNPDLHYKAIDRALEKFVDVGYLEKTFIKNRKAFHLSGKPLPEMSDTKGRLKANYEKEREEIRDYFNSKETWECLTSFFPDINQPLTTHWRSELQRKAGNKRWKETRKFIRSLNKV